MTTDSQTCLTMLRISIQPSFHSSLYHFCVNCHLSIIMVSGCWSPSQKSLGEKQDCDKNSFEMEFHLYCLFSHCQTVRVLNLCTLTNEATLRGGPNRWMGVFPSNSNISNEGPVWEATCFGGTSDVPLLLFFCREKGLIKTRGHLSCASIWNTKENGTNLEKLEHCQNFVIPTFLVFQKRKTSEGSLTRITFLSISSLATLRQPLYKCMTAKTHQLLWTGVRCSPPQGFPTSFQKILGIVGLY